MAQPQITTHAWQRARQRNADPTTLFYTLQRAAIVNTARAHAPLRIALSGVLPEQLVVVRYCERRQRVECLTVLGAGQRPNAWTPVVEVAA